MNVVEQNGLAVAGSFGEPHIPRNHAFEDLRAKETSEIGSDLARESRSLVIHSEDDALDGEGRIERSANTHQGIEQLGNAFESKVFALDGNQHRVAGNQGIQRDEVESGRTIDDDEAILRAELVDDVFEAILATIGAGELEGSSGEVFVRWNDIQALNLGFSDDPAEILAENEAVIKRTAGRIFLEAEAGSTVRLRIRIDEKGWLFARCDGSGKVDCRGGLAYAAFLIGHSDYARQINSSVEMMLRRGNVAERRHCVQEIFAMGADFPGRVVKNVSRETLSAFGGSELFTNARIGLQTRNVIVSRETIHDAGCPIRTTRRFDSGMLTGNCHLQPSMRVIDVESSTPSHKITRPPGMRACRDHLNNGR